MTVMNRPHYKSILVAAATVVLAILMIGCGGSGSSNQSDEAMPAPNPAAKPVDETTAGTVTGVVKFDGTPPPRKAINMSAVPNCAKLRDSPAMTEEVVPGDNGTLQNVVVYLDGDFSEYSFPRSSAPVMADQKGCVYEPHVAALMTGESLQVTSSDTATHNVNAMAKRNRSWNQTEPPGAAPITHQFAREEVAIRVACNVHPWMRMYIAVVGHPYFQVTGKDGSFSLKNVPPGTYTLTAWHERYGTRKQTITIQPKQEQTATITFAQ